MNELPFLNDSGDYGILQSISDTLNVIGPKVQQIAEASDPVIAQTNLTMSKIAAIAGVLGAVFGLGSFIFSKITAQNVKRTTKSNRLKLSDWLIQTIYQRMAYIRALINNKSLISPNFLMTSVYLPQFVEDCLIIEDYRNNAKRYSYLLRFKSQINIYNSIVDFCIRKQEKGTEIADRELLDLLEISVKLLVELSNFNGANKAQYPDRILSVIIDHHYDFIRSIHIPKTGKKLSINLPSETDRGMDTFSKLMKNSDFTQSRKSVSKKEQYRLSEILSEFVDKKTLKKYISLLTQVKTADKDFYDRFISYFACVWSLDSAIVAKEMQRYTKTTINIGNYNLI